MGRLLIGSLKSIGHHYTRRILGLSHEDESLHWPLLVRLGDEPWYALEAFSALRQRRLTASRLGIHFHFSMD